MPEGSENKAAALQPHTAARDENDARIAKLINDAAVPLRNVATRDEADSTIELTNSFVQTSAPVLGDLIDYCLDVIAREGNNNTSHFVLVHALLAKGAPAAGNPNATEESEMRRDLENRLQAIGWSNKISLYAHWLSTAKRLRTPSCVKASALLISNQFKPDVVINVKALRAQGGEELEIVFVNNGAPSGDYAEIMPFVDTYIETRGDSGAYLSRNLAAVYANGPVLLFVDDDGIPEGNFVSGHLDAQAGHSATTVRGVCRPKTQGSMMPKHYHLGEKVIPSIPNLEGNTSFDRNAFFNIGGWGDYILFGHGGVDVASRLVDKGYSSESLLYTPSAVLLHDYIRGEAHAAEKFAKQAASRLLLDALGTTGLAPVKKTTP